MTKSIYETLLRFYPDKHPLEVAERMTSGARKALRTKLGNELFHPDRYLVWLRLVDYCGGLSRPDRLFLLDVQNSVDGEGIDWSLSTPAVQKAIQGYLAICLQLGDATTGQFSDRR